MSTGVSYFTSDAAAGITLIFLLRCSLQMFVAKQQGSKIVNEKMEEVSRAGEWRHWRRASASLREWRASGENKTDLVLKLGRRLLREHSSSLANECETFCLRAHV